MSKQQKFPRHAPAWFALSLLLTMTAVSIPGRVDADQADAPPVLMLSAELEDPSQTNAAGKPIDASTWVREIFRQHILMIAREEFGFVTRDATLGEPVDPDSPECFHLKVLAWEHTPAELTLRRGKKVIYEGTVVNEVSDGLKKFRLLPKHVTDTRDSVIQAFKAAGYKQKPLPKDRMPALPQEIEALLGRINTISQYAAVRRLHHLLQEQGESPAVLGGLVRGYAHLSQLTLPLLDMRHRAFGARSLLYAHRLGRLTPESAAGYWHRAYTFAFLGYPREAHRELKAAKNHATEVTPEPKWLELISHSVRYRFSEFERLVEDEKYELRETAALLWFMASRMSASPAFTIETGLKVRKVIPDSQRIIAGMFDTAGVAMNHQLSVEGAPAQLATISEHLTEVADLPESVTSELKLKTGDDQDKTDQEILRLKLTSSSLLEAVTQLLRAAGEKDSHEPSFYVLDSTLRAWNLQQLCQRACFLREYLGVDAGDLVASTQSIVKGDPFGPLYASMGLSIRTHAEAASEITKDIPHVELNYCSVGYDFLKGLPREARTKDGTVNDYLTLSWRDAGDFEETVRKRINDYSAEEFREDRLKQVEWLDSVSVNSPLHYSERVLLDWASVSDKADEWAVQYASYPDLHFALARACKSFGSVDRAIEHYKQYLEMIQDARGYSGLAEALYMKDRKSDKWMSALEDSMKCEDYFLTHSTSAQKAASTLMRDGRFKDALPWAERAAESGSGQGLLCLVEALTGTGEFKRAESICRQISQRYQSNDWYLWCFATGKGDLESAWEAEQERLRQQLPAGDVQAEAIHALHSSNQGDDAQALEILLRILNNRMPGETPYVWADSLAYLIADREGNDKACSQILKVYQEQKDAPENVQAIAAMLTLFDESDDGNAIDPRKIQTVIEKHAAFFNSDWLPDLALFIGYFEWTHGRPDKAIEQWKIPAGLPGGYSRMLAWKWLRDAKVDPVHIPDRTFPNAFLREAYKLPTKKK